jgi:hypothetical protein
VDGSALGFAAFVLAHTGCAGEADEARLDGDTLAYRCRGCGEARVFGQGIIRGRTEG